MQDWLPTVYDNYEEKHTLWGIWIHRLIIADTLDRHWTCDPTPTSIFARDWPYAPQRSLKFKIQKQSLVIYTVLWRVSAFEQAHALPQLHVQNKPIQRISLYVLLSLYFCLVCRSIKVLRLNCSDLLISSWSPYHTWHPKKIKNPHIKIKENKLDCPAGW